MGVTIKKHLSEHLGVTFVAAFVAVLLCAASLLASSSAQAGSGDLTQPSGTAGCILNLEPSTLGCELEPEDYQIMEDVSGVAVSEDGRSVYAGAKIGDGIATLNRNASNHGALSQSSGSGFCQADSLTGASKTNAASCGLPDDVLSSIEDVAVSSDGLSVYATSSSGASALDSSGNTWNAHNGALLWFSRNTSTGELSYQDCWVPGLPSFTGRHRAQGCNSGTFTLRGANSVTVSKDGEAIYVTGGSSSSGGLTVMERDTSTGSLTFVGGSSLPTAASCFVRGASSSTGCTRVHSILSAQDLVETDSNLYVVSKDTRAVTALEKGSASSDLTALSGFSECVANDDDGRSGTNVAYTTSTSGARCGSTTTGSTVSGDGPLYSPTAIAANSAGTQVYVVSGVSTGGTGTGSEGTLSIYSIIESGSGTIGSLHARDAGTGYCYTSSPNQMGSGRCDESLDLRLLNDPQDITISPTEADGGYHVYTSSAAKHTVEHFTGFGQYGGVSYGNCYEDSAGGPGICGETVRGLYDPSGLALSAPDSSGLITNLYVGVSGAEPNVTPGLTNHYGGVAVLEREAVEEPPPPTTTTTPPTTTPPTTTVPTTTTTPPTTTVPTDPKTVLEEQGFCTDFSTAKAKSTVSSWKSVKKSGKTTQTAARLEIEGTSNIVDGRSKFYARFRQKTAIKSNRKGKIKRYSLTKAKTITVYIDDVKVDSAKNKKKNSIRFKLKTEGLSAGEHELKVKATFSGVKGTKTWTRSFSYGDTCSPTHYTYNQLGSWNKKARMTWSNIFRAGNVPLQDATFTMTGAAPKASRFKSLYKKNSKIGELRLQKKETGTDDDEWTSAENLKLLDYDSSTKTYTLLEPSSSTPKVTLNLSSSKAVVEVTSMPEGYVGVRTDLGERKGSLYKLFYTPSKCAKSVKFSVKATSHPDINTTYTKSRSKKTCSESK